MSKQIVLSFVGLLAMTASATQYYWTGAVDSDYTNPKNWVTGTKTSTTVPSACPKSDDSSDSVSFTDRAPADKRTVNLPGARASGTVTFDSPGWVITGGEWTTKKVVCTGKDLGRFVEFKNSLKIKGQGIQVPAGGEVYLSGWSTFKDGEMQLNGNGTLRVAKRIGLELYSNEKGCKITNGGLLWSEASPAFSSHSSYYFWMTFGAANARYRFKGTTAAAEKLFETKTKGEMNFVNAFDKANYQLAVKALDGDLEGYVEVYLTPTGAPKIESAALAKTDDGAIAVTFCNGASVVDYSVLASDGTNEPIDIPLATSVAASADETRVIDFSTLAANKTYTLTLKAFKGDLAVTEKLGIVYNGTPTLVKIADAQELGEKSGSFTVSRADASTLALTVNLAYSSADGAVAGETYVVPATTVTIPAGETSVTIELVPKSDPKVTEDSSVDVALADGFYQTNAEPIAIVIKNIVIPEGTAVWMAADDSDGLASNPANWYGGKLPTEDEVVLLTAAFSSKKLTWDGGINGLPTRVASWHQQGWNGTVVIPTTYEGDFTTLEIGGDALIDSGTWTTPANGADETYILNVAVGGVLTIGADAKIDVQGKGFATGKFREGSGIGAHAATGTGNVNHIYGDVKAPTSIGSGGDSSGGAGSCGGGAIRLTVAGAAVIDGTLDAQSSSQSTPAKPNPEKGVGAGGSIFVTAASISGSGTLVASAYEANGTSYTSVAGSGGRIALVATEGEVTLPLAKLRANGSVGARSVGGGTIVVKNADEPNGTLLISDTKAYSSFNYVTHWPTKLNFATVKPGETWTFDKVLFRGDGVLALPTDATLSLPNGFASIGSLSTSATPTTGLLMRGGVIDVPETETHELKGAWLLQGETPYTFPKGAVALSEKASIGCFRLSPLTDALESVPTCTVAVDGDLTVASGATLWGEGRGYRTFVNTPYGGCHGGVVVGAEAKAFDSILNPTLPGESAGMGNGGSDNNTSGAAIALNVSGTFTMNGTASVKSGETNWGAARAGSGSLNITAGRLVGTGSFSADGLKTANRDGLSGAGGRIAIRLTEKDATFESFGTAKITADAAFFDPTKAASAGTIYLQAGDEAEGAGTVIVKSSMSEVGVATPIPSRLKGGETDELKNAKLAIERYGIAQLTAATKMSSLTMTAPAKLDLNGRTLTVTKAKLGDLKLKPSTYKASDAALEGFVTDSSEAETGTLVVTGGGIVIFVK